MTKRILSLVLAVLMVTAAFGIPAAAHPTTQNAVTLDSILAQLGSTAVERSVVINTVVVVDKDTTIPANVTVNVGTNGIMVITAKLTVYGTLNASSTQLIVSGDGAIVYKNSPAPNEYWIKYDPNYPWTYFPMSGPYCTVCARPSVAWCPTCSDYHCHVCKSHLPGTTLPDNNQYCPTHKCEKMYCTMCRQYYCPAHAGGVHGYDPVNKTCVIVPYTNVSYCRVHTDVKIQYCDYCNEYYCPQCDGGVHVLNPYTGICYIYNGGNFIPPFGDNIIPDWWYDYYFNNKWDYIYVPGYGFIIPSYFCTAPKASIASGTSVTAGTTVTLTTTTVGAVIYYTTDGSIPTASSKIYTGPIEIKEDMVIRAIAVSRFHASSDVATFKYTVKKATLPNVFTDVKNNPKLVEALNILLDNKVIEKAAKFNPNGTVSWKDLSTYLKAIGADPAKSSVKETDFKNKDVLTYEEMVVACYRVLFANKMIRSSHSGNQILNNLKHIDEITDKALTKAAYKAMIEKEALLELDFRPKENATRAYLAYMISIFC